jgi:Uma2 family endonuclease
MPNYQTLETLHDSSELPNSDDNLPNSSELPDSDDTPVSELQILVPTLLHDILCEKWNKRTDWFFGVNMGIYHTTGKNLRIPIVPDGFLCMGVKQWKPPYGRSSYVVWEENDIVPSLVLEYVSQTYGGEYDEKMLDYARLGVLYYVIYNPHSYHKRSHKHDALEVYRLVEEKYVLQPGQLIWLPEIDLGIGASIGMYKNRRSQWLYWYDKDGARLPTPTEKNQQALRDVEQAQLDAEQAQLDAKQAQRHANIATQRAEQAEWQTAQERQRAEQAEWQTAQERQRAERLAQLLRDKGVDIDTLS